MMRALLLAAALLFPGVAWADAFSSVAPGVLPDASGNVPFAKLGNIPSVSDVRLRQPQPTDDTNALFAVGQYWKTQDGALWLNQVATANNAEWSIAGPNVAYPCDAAGGCYTAYGPVQIVSGYAGNAFDVLQNGTTTINIGFVRVAGSSLPVADWAKADATCLSAGNSCVITKWYNQTTAGATHDCIPYTAAANMPYGSYAVNGLRTMKFDGTARMTAGATVGASCSDANYSQSSQAHTEFFLGRVNEGAGTAQNPVLAQFGGSTTATYYSQLGYAQWLVQRLSPGLNYVTTAGTFSHSAQVFGVSQGTTTTTYYNDDGSQTTGNFGAATMTGIAFGNDTAVESNSWWADMDLFGVMTFGSELTAAKVAALKAAAYGAFPIYPQVRTGIVTIGDSITAGLGAAGGRNWSSLVANAFARPLRHFNLGRPSATCANFTSGNFLAEVQKAPTLQTSNIIVIECGTNDLSDSLGNASAATALTNMQSLIAAVRAVDATDPIIVLTVMDRTSCGGVCTNFNAQAPTYNTNLKAAVAAGTLGTGPIYVADVAANANLGPPASGVAASSTYFATDHIHPTERGHRLMANGVISTITANQLLK